MQRDGQTDWKVTDVLNVSIYVEYQYISGWSIINEYDITIRYYDLILRYNITIRYETSII